MIRGQVSASRHRRCGETGSCEFVRPPETGPPALGYVLPARNYIWYNDFDPFYGKWSIQAKKLMPKIVVSVHLSLRSKYVKYCKYNY
jgi:hypothetical protein